VRQAGEVVKPSPTVKRARGFSGARP
jgi:hypothetical protein